MTIDEEKQTDRGTLITAMSGGVDSTVAALLLAEQGYEVSGATFRLYEESEKDLTSAFDAQKACSYMGFPHYIFDFREYFRETVIKDFADTYVKGDTPNPCVVCNKKVKFRMMEKIADDMSIEYISTGHYATTKYDSGSERYLLMKAVDTKKDQSYVLYNLSQSQLKRLVLPLGSMTKEKIRNIAQSHGLEIANKPDSQDICFVKDGDYASFLREKCGIDSKSGDFILNDGGAVVGTHKGIINYTIGQRKGLGVSGGRPLFVISKNLENNKIVLGDNQDLFSRRVYVRDMNFISIQNVTSPINVTAKLRYSQKEAKAVFHPLSETGGLLEFEEGQRAVTTGQSAVLYDGDTVVGGGIIESCEK